MDKRNILYPAATFTAAFAVALGIGLAEAHASDVNWDAIAQCESSGNWHANTGNGYYGGLQFTLQTWKANGGLGNPANASKAEQIRVAENVVSSQGLSAWPECGVEAYSHLKTHYSAPKPVKKPKTGSWTSHNHRPKSGICMDDVSRGPYLVRPGDNLTRIGRKFNVTWKMIYRDRDNNIKNPNLIYPNEILCIPFEKGSTLMH